MTQTFDAIRLLQDRSSVVPANIPIDAVIFNAPRPIYGTVAWQGDFCSGVFYTAVTPDDEYRNEWIKKNKAYDARVLLFIDDATARQMVREWIASMNHEIADDVFEEHWRESFKNRFARCAVEV